MASHDRALVLSGRLRQLTFEGARYGYTSAVPLAYLSGSPALWEVLHRFSAPARVSDAAPGLGVDELGFLDELVVAGVLVDAERPDPVHSLRPPDDEARTLVLYPTSSCNLRCVYCYATSGPGAGPRIDRKSTRLNSSHSQQSRMPSSA